MTMFLVFPRNLKCRDEQFRQRFIRIVNTTSYPILANSFCILGKLPGPDRLMDNGLNQKVNMKARTIGQQGFSLLMSAEVFQISGCR